MLRLAASRGGGPETRSGTVQCCHCQQKRAARLQRGSKVLRLAASRGGPRNALGHRPEPEVLPLPAETSREAPKLRLAGGGETRAGTVQSLKCCPCQQKRVARLERGSKVLRLAASRGGGPETRSGTVQSLKCTVQSLKCCPCQQKRAARLESAAPGSIEGGGAPKRARAPSRA